MSSELSSCGKKLFRVSILELRSKNLSMSSLFDTILDPRQYVLSIFLIFLYNLKSVR